MNKVLVFITITLGLYAESAFSNQNYYGKDGDTIKISISKKEPNRLAMKEGVKIIKIWGDNKHFTPQVDKTQGELFFKPNDQSPSKFSFFIRDSNKNTYTINANSLDIPSQAILIKSIGKKKFITNENTKSWNGVGDYEKSIKNLIKDMSIGNKVKGYYESNEKDLVHLWKEAEIKLDKSYEGVSLIGNKYLITNISKILKG